MAAKPREFLPGLCGICRAEHSGVLHPGVHGVRIGERGLEMPDSFELPWMGRAVVPLVSSGNAVVHKPVAARWFPRLATITGALDHLPKPTAGLRCIQTVWIDGRALDMVDFPPWKVGATDVPVRAGAVRCQDERAFFRPYQNPYCAHGFPFLTST